MIAKVELVDDLERARSIAVELEQECAELRNRVQAALAIVERDLPEACYSPEYMEYEDDPCPRCLLRAELTLPDPLTLDRIAGRTA